MLKVFESSSPLTLMAIEEVDGSRKLFTVAAAPRKKNQAWNTVYQRLAFVSFNIPEHGALCQVSSNCESTREN